MSRTRTTFHSLSVHNYRLYFGGQAISVAGTWMQRVAQSWLVLELTGSGTLLGITVALQHLPTLLVGPWGGLMADRFDKRRIVLLSQAGAGALALILAVLTLTGTVQLWMVLVLAFLLGAIESFDRPARHTFVLEMVGREHLTNAITLHSIVVNIGKSAGPAIAGILIAAVGTGITFMVNSLSYAGVVIALLLMRQDELSPAVPSGRGRGQLRDGISHAIHTPALFGPLVLMTVAGMLTFEWSITLPLLAEETFDGGARTFGFMFSAMGLGAVVGGLFVAGVLQASQRSLLATGLIYCLLILGVAGSPTVSVALLILFATGAANLALRVLANSLLQLSSDPDMRGRVIALLSVGSVGTRPLGAPLVGWVAEHFGARASLAGGAAATLIALAWVWGFVRRRGVLDPGWEPRPWSSGHDTASSHSSPGQHEHRADRARPHDS